MKIDGNVIELRGAETSIDVDAPLRIKDGASFVDVRNYIAPVFQYENLVVKNNAATPNSQIDVSWDSLYIGPIHSTTYTQTLNIESDTDWDSGDHTDEPANGWIYLWAMAKIDGTCDPFYSLSATSPTLPTGYIFSKLISVVRNISGNFIPFYQTNEIYSRTPTAIQTTGTSTTYADTTTVSLANAAPDLSIIKAYLGEVNQATSGVFVALTTNASLLEEFYLRIGTADITVSFVLHRSGSVFKYKTAATGSIAIFLTGYLLNI